MPPGFAGFVPPGKLATVVATSLAVVAAPLATLPSTSAAAPGPGAPSTPAAVRGVAAQETTAAVSPVTPVVREYPVRAAAPSQPDGVRGAGADPGRVRTLDAPRPVSGYGVVGATWVGSWRGLTFTVRTRVGPAWSQWQRLHGGGCPCAQCAALRTANGHGPDPGTAEARSARSGTDALAVGDVDAVQLRVTSVSGQLPTDLTLAVVNPGTAVADGTDQAPAVDAATSPEAAPSAPSLEAATRSGLSAPRPEIFTRAQWGADERMRSGSPSYGTVRAGFVHHTVNSNDYSRGDVPAIIRGIYAYHTQSLGWSDIGYNFLVDRFGRTWEGRYGGMDRPVIGAHTYGYNHTAFAMSAIGNFDVVRPPTRVLRAYSRLFAWKLALHGIRAKSTQTMEGDTFAAISGHRDAGQTACPGRYLFAKLDVIRNRAADAQRSKAAPPEPTGPDVSRDLLADGHPDLVVRDAATDELQVLAGDGGPGFAARAVFDEKARSTGLVTGVRDVTGDGRQDLLVQHRRTKVAKVRPGRGGGEFANAIGSSATKRFTRADVVAGVGDMVGSRRPDVIARDARTGDVSVYAGRADLGWAAGRVLLRGAGDLSLLSGAGDLDRDGDPDLLARAGQRLLLYPGRGDGRIGEPRVIARGWGTKDLTVAGYDVTGDGRPDVVARERATGRTSIHVTRRDGTVGRRYGAWKGWAGLGPVSGVGGSSGGGAPTFVARTPGRQLVSLRALDARWLQGPTPTGGDAADADFAEVAGDWDSDGHDDVVTRSPSSGTVWLYPGDGTGGLDERVAMWTGWREQTDLVVTGDVSGDDRPDLLARHADGPLYVYPSDGRGGKQARYVARERLFAVDLAAPAGFWNRDATRDLIVRRERTQQLYLLPGATGGTFGPPVRLAGSFAAYDTVVGVGDFDGDGHPDLVARRQRTGQLWLFAGTPTGLRARQFVAAGTGRFDLIG